MIESEWSKIQCLLAACSRRICPGIALCYGHRAAGTQKPDCLLFGVSLYYRHYKVNMITWFGVLCISSFLLQIQLNNTCLKRATLPVCGIFNEKKQGKSLLTSKDVVLDWFSLRPSYILPKVVHSFVPFQFLPFRLFGCKAGPESFTTTLQVFIPPKFYWTLLLELR